MGLGYRWGLDINVKPTELGSKIFPPYGKHKFLIIEPGSAGSQLEGICRCVDSHWDIQRNVNRDTKKTGGSFYVNDNKELIVNYFSRSGSYSVRPIQVHLAREFAEHLFAELKKKIDIRSVSHVPTLSEILTLDTDFESLDVLLNKPFEISENDIPLIGRIGHNYRKRYGALKGYRLQDGWISAGDIIYSHDHSPEMRIFLSYIYHCSKVRNVNKKFLKAMKEVIKETAPLPKKLSHDFELKDRDLWCSKVEIRLKDIINRIIYNQERIHKIASRCLSHISNMYDFFLKDDKGMMKEDAKELLSQTDLDHHLRGADAFLWSLFKKS